MERHPHSLGNFHVGSFEKHHPPQMRYLGPLVFEDEAQVVAFSTAIDGSGDALISSLPLCPRPKRGSQALSTTCAPFKSPAGSSPPTPAWTKKNAAPELFTLTWIRRAGLHYSFMRRSHLVMK